MDALIQLGAQLDTRNHEGHTPMHYGTSKLRTLLHEAMGAMALPSTDSRSGLVYTERGQHIKTPCTACGWSYGKGIKTCPWCLKKELTQMD